MKSIDMYLNSKKYLLIFVFLILGLLGLGAGTGAEVIDPKVFPSEEIFSFFRTKMVSFCFLMAYFGIFWVFFRSYK